MVLALLALPATAAELTEVVIDGVGDELVKSLRARLSLVEVIARPDVPPSYIRYLHERAPGELRAAMEPFGYYNAEVSGELREQGGDFQARYTVQPGPATHVVSRRLELTGPGSDDPVLDETLAAFPLAEGDVFDHRRYERGKRQMLQQFAERGYFDAETGTARVEVSREDNEARIHVQWRTGPRYRFGDLTIEGSQVAKGLVRVQAPFEPGDTFHQEDLLALQQGLRGTEYFATIDVVPAVEQAQDTGSTEVPVKVTVTPAKRNVYSAGVAVGTDIGAAVDVGYERRWLNRRGHRLETDLRFGNRRSTAGVGYVLPSFRHPDTQTRLFGSYDDRKSDSNDRTTGRVGVSRSGRWGEWRPLLSLELLDEKYEIGDERDRASLLVPSLRLTHLEVDDPLFINRGWRISGFVRGSVANFLSDSSFVQAGGDVTFIQSLPWRNRLILRGQGGTTWSDEFFGLPPTYRFFAGGDRSVRGYDYEELGPTDADGDVVGGKHLLVGSVELEHMFNDTWGVAAFLDAGNAFDFDQFVVKRGAGLGLRWRSPLGLVRVDVARALDKPGRPFRLHLVIGPTL